VIRPLEAGDREAWEPLWRGYLDFYETTLPAEVSDAAFRRLSQRTDGMFGLVDEDAGALRGFVHCVAHPATWSATGYCYLEDLFVDPGARGGGVGRALIEAVYAEADARGLDRVYWLTDERNTTARRLYDEVGRYSGFVKYERR
jgi:GNAT superfamily N-acetyltransferase